MNLSYIYCDHNATTPINSVVQQSFVDSFLDFGNASSLYQLGRRAKESLEMARQLVADFVGASVDQLIFTSSGTEGNNQVLIHFLNLKLRSLEPMHILVSAIEHSSVMTTVQHLEKFGIEYDVVTVDEQGVVDIEHYQSLFKPYTKLVSIALANNEIGTIQDINRLATIAHDKGALFHSDAVQALGKLDINVYDLDVDFMSFSAHKIYAPKGVGALYIKDESTFTPMLFGGHHERGLRASTENVAGIVAFGVAIKQLNVQIYQRHTQSLVDRLLEGLSSLEHVSVNGPLSIPGLSNTLNMTFGGCSGYALAMNCDLEGIAVSTGSACSVGSIEPSHVLQAIGMSIDDNKSSVRFSVGLTNTLEEMVVVIEKVKEIVDRLRCC